jgi:hypothetical protein
MKSTPLVFLILGALAWGLHRRSAFILFAVVIAVLWLLLALAQFSKRLVLDDDAIRMHGYFGGPITIMKADVTSCRYVTARPDGAGRGGIDMFFLEIRDSAGHGIRVWRRGWGRKRPELFKLLSAWLDGCSLALDERTRAFLATAGR